MFDLRKDLDAQARRLGFVAVGVTAAVGQGDDAARLADWLAQGMHGTMEWMANRADERSAPDVLWPQASRVISLGMSYAPQGSVLEQRGHGDRGCISTYAQGGDYHKTVKKALKALARWLIDEARMRGIADAGVKVFVDTAPVMEKPVAQRAGLGWQGKHTNLVSRDHGSWLFLGEIYTTLDLPVDEPQADHCGSCRACQMACPTDAFPAPYRLDARRCISYLTIEHAGQIPEEFRDAIGNRIYGCDDCLAVCPWNKFAQSAAAARSFIPRAELVSPRLADLLALDDAGFRQLFSGSPIKRIGRSRFVRNCLIAAGNSEDASLAPHVSDLRGDSDPVVAEAAAWALAKLAATASP